MGKRAIAAALVALGAFGLAPARAEPPPPAERAQLYSAYERETIAVVLDALHAKRHLSPEAKTIERIDVVPLDVLEPRDPLSGWGKDALNALHATTRKRVIRRELLVAEGDAYRQVLVDDTIRNLRRLPQLSVVLVVATEGSAPDRVGLVVITKDVWSLRLAWNVVGTPGGIEQFEIQPSEENFLGTHQTVFGHFLLQPSTYTLGLGYQIPRLEDSRVAMVARADVVINQTSGAPEGSYGTLIAGQPLSSGVAEWAWDSTVFWEDVIARVYRNAQLSAYKDPAAAPDESCPSPRCIPFQWGRRRYAADYELTRSFGWDKKHDLTFGAGITRNVYRTNFPGADPRTVATFVAKFVPVSDTRVGPWVQYHSYTKRYLRVIDFETLALQEDYHVGHDIVLSMYPSLRALGSSRDVISLTGSAQYTFSLRDGLFRLSFASLTEPEADRVADATVSPTAHLVSPSIAGLGRVVVDGTLRYYWRNYLNHVEYLGGGDRLRGYPTNFFAGRGHAGYLAYNVELRSRPVEILSCQLAGVLFYDAGDAFDGLRNLEPFQSVGFGLRALFPQLDRIVFRADLGFPVERPIDSSTGRPIAPLGFLVSFGQAFRVPTVAPTPVLPTGESEQSTE
jgi:hypothetical protein